MCDNAHVFACNNTAVHLRDITFATEGNTVFFDNVDALINFERLRLIYRSIACTQLLSEPTTNYSHLSFNPTLGKLLQDVCDYQPTVVILYRCAY
jgi:hypothetical protein